MLRALVPHSSLAAILWCSFTVLPSGAGQATQPSSEQTLPASWRRLVPVPYAVSELQHLRDVWPQRTSPRDLQVLRRAGLTPGASRRLYFVGEFRIVDWNAAAHDEKFNADSSPLYIASHILRQVDNYNANVIALQEIREDVYLQLVFGLLWRSRAWTCEAHEFGAMVDLRVTCVKGPLNNIRVARLSNFGPLNVLYKHREFWGYMQVDYFGVTITNVHTRDHWDTEHVNQLHQEVKSGVVVGDFNYETPEEALDDGSDWHQTDVVGLPTWSNVKVDHVLTVEPHVMAQAEVAGTHGSNHETLLTRFRFLVPLASVAP